jgi:hypothetical protein
MATHIYKLCLLAFRFPCHPLFVTAQKVSAPKYGTKHDDEAEKVKH